jgi:hypothetical protein
MGFPNRAVKKWLWLAFFEEQPFSSAPRQEDALQWIAGADQTAKWVCFLNFRGPAGSGFSAVAWMTCRSTWC